MTIGVCYTVDAVHEGSLWTQAPGEYRELFAMKERTTTYAHLTRTNGSYFARVVHDLLIYRKSLAKGNGAQLTKVRKERSNRVLFGDVLGL